MTKSNTNDRRDALRASIIADKVEGRPLDSVVHILMTILLGLCEQLDQKGVDATKLLEGITIDQQLVRRPVDKNNTGRFGTA